MLEFEYQNIISHWSKEYGISFSELQRKILIDLYEKALVSEHFKNVDFDIFTQNVFKQKFYNDKYPGLDVFGGAYSRRAQN